MKGQKVTPSGANRRIHREMAMTSTCFRTVPPSCRGAGPQDASAKRSPRAKLVVQVSEVNRTP